MGTTSGPSIKRASPEIEDHAFELALDGKKLEEISNALGLKGVRSLQRYFIKYPEFLEMYERAKIAECIVIEEKFERILKDYSVEASKIQIEIYSRLLKWRNPKKYGDKQQIEITKVDIGAALDAAERRVLEATVSNVIEIGARTEKD